MHSVLKHRHLSLCLAAVLLVSAVTALREPDDGPTRPGNSATVKRFPSMFAKEAHRVEHTFSIANTTNRTLHVDRVAKGCACTNVSIESNEIAPGGQASLTMTVDLRGRSGPFAAECIVHHDAGVPLRFRVEVEIYPRIEFQPHAIYLGTVQAKESITRQFSIVTYARGSVPAERQLSITPADTDASLRTLETSTEQLADGFTRRTTSVSLELTTPGEVGRGDLAINTELTVPERLESSMRVEWFVESPYRLSPQRAFFGSVDAANGKMRKVVSIDRADGSPFTTGGVASGSDALVCTCATAGTPAMTHDIELQLAPSEVEEFFYTEVAVTLEDDRYPIVRIPVAASR